MRIRVRDGFVVAVGVLLGLFSCLMAVGSGVTGGEWALCFVGVGALFVASGVTMLTANWRRYTGWPLLLMGVLALVISLGSLPDLGGRSPEGHPLVYFLGSYWLCAAYGLGVGIAMLVNRKKLPDGPDSR